MGAYGCRMEAVGSAWEAAVKIGRLAYWSMLEEVGTTPKPGLVDRYSNGAHMDMDIHTFERSACALMPYFCRMAYQGIMMAHAPELLFLEIRKTGIMAEEAMYAATNGVNTHKGIIFHIGILSAAAGACLKNHGVVTAADLIQMEQSMVTEVLTREIAFISKNETQNVDMANGEKNLRRYGMAGARGEALDGYPSVLEVSLPVLEQGLKAKIEWNRIKLQTLFALMECVEDSNIISRHDPDMLKEVQGIAREFLKSGGAYQHAAIERLQEMDGEFIRRKLSSGGCADLLAVTIFVAGLTADGLGKRDAG